MAADEIEKFFQDLQNKKPDMKKLEASLQEIIAQLMAKKEYLENLEKTLKESQEENVDESLKEIERIRIRIIFLIEQAKTYHFRLVSTQGTQGRDESDVENFTALFKDLNVWLTRPKDLVKERVDSNNLLETEDYTKRLEDSLKDCRTRLQNLVLISPRVQELTRNQNLAPLGAPSLLPQLETLQRELTLVDQQLTDRLQALQDILNSFVNRSREPSKPEPELAATKLNRKSKPAPIFVPQPVPAVRKEDAPVRPDGSFTNVCSRVEETYSSFPPSRSTIESTFKPIEMSDPRSVHTKSSKHKKPPVITTETYDDRHRAQDERTPDNEYSAEQVSQKVFDFLEIDEPESLSLGDETIDSRASPIPNEEVINLDSPRFEYYEEIKFKDPVRYGQSRPVEQHEVYETSDFPESSRRRQYVTQMVVDETGKPVTSTTTRKYYIKGVRDPQQVKEYKYVRLFDPNNLDETNQFEMSPYDEQPMSVQIQDGTRTVVRTIRRRIIRKVVIINGKETVTEEVVEEPVEENVSEYDQPEITEIEDDSLQKLEKQYYIVSKGVKEVDKTPETSDSSKSRTDEYPSFDVRQVKSVLRPEAKEFTPSYSLSKSTEISFPQDSSFSSDTTKPARFGFMIRDSPLDVSEHSLPEDTITDDKISEPTSNVIYVSTKEEDMKKVRLQRKKKKKRKGEKETEEPEKTGDDQKDTESLDSYEDESDEDLIKKDGKLIQRTKTIVVTKDGFEKEKSPSFSDSSKPSKPKKESKDSLEDIEKMIIVTDDKTRKHDERKGDEKKPKDLIQTKVFVGKETTPVTISSEKSVERKPKDGKTPVESEAPEKPIPVEESKDKPKSKSEMVKEKEQSPIDKETDKKTKDKKGKPYNLEDNKEPKTEEMKPDKQTPGVLKPTDKKEAKPKADSKKKPEDDEEKRPDDIKIKPEDRKSSEKEKLQPFGTTVTETSIFEQEPGKKDKLEVFGKAPGKPKQKFFDITQFIEQEQQPVDEASTIEKEDKRVKGKSPESDKLKPEKPDEKDKTRDKKERTPDKDKLFGKEVKSSQPEKPKDEEQFKVGPSKGGKDKSRPVDESKTQEQGKQETIKVSKPKEIKEKEEKPEKDKPRGVDIGKIPDQKDIEPSKVFKTKKEKPKSIEDDVVEVPKELGEDKLPKKEEPSKVEKPKREKEKVKEEKTPETSLKPIGEVKVKETKPAEQTHVSLEDREYKVGKPKDTKDKHQQGKDPEIGETKPVDVSKTVEHKTFPTYEHQTHKTEKPEEKDETKPPKKQEKGKKEKTPEEDKSKPGKEISETLKFIQFGYRVSLEDERSGSTQDKTMGKDPEKKKPIEVGKKPAQTTVSGGDELLRDVKLIGRKQKTPDTDKSVEMGKTPDQAEEIRQPKDDKDKKGKKPGKDALDKIEKREEEKPKDSKETDEKPKQSTPTLQDDELFRGVKLIGRKEKTPDKGTPAELGKEPEKPTESVKHKDDKHRKEKKPGQDKPEELAKVPEQFKSREPSKVDEPTYEKEKHIQGKPTQKDKSKPVDKDTFGITSFIEHEKPKRDTLDKVEKREEEKPKDSKETDEKPKQSTPTLQDDEVFRGVKLIGRKEKTPDKGTPAELGKEPEKPTESVKFKDDKDKKGKKPGQDKPEELAKESEKPKQIEKTKDENEKKEKAPVTLPEMSKTQEKPKPLREDDELIRGVSLIGRKQKTPDTDKPVEPGEVLHQKEVTEKPGDNRATKGKKPDKDKPENLPKSQETSAAIQKSIEEKDKDITPSIGGKPHDKGKKEKTPEDKPKPGKEISETLKFIQFGYRVSPEDERSEAVKLTRDKPKDKGTDKEKPLEIGKKPGLSEGDELSRDVRLIGRKQKTPDTDKPMEVGKTPEQTQEKPKDDKDKKGKKPGQDKPEELAKMPEQPKSREPSKVDEPTDEKPSVKDTEDKPKKPEETKPKDDKQGKEKPRQPEPLLEGDELLRDVKLIGRKQKTPDTDKPLEVGKTPEQTQEKPKDDKDKKGKKPGQDKPEELAKVPEQFKSREPSKVDEPTYEKEKHIQGKPTQKDKSKPVDKDTFGITSFIEHEKPKRDTLDKVEKREEEKPKDSKETDEKPKQSTPTLQDDEVFRGVKLIGRKEKTPDKGIPVELDKKSGQTEEAEKLKSEKKKKGKKSDEDKLEEFAKTPEQPQSEEPRKGEKPGKDKPEELAKAPEQPKSREPSKVDEPTDEKDKDKTGKLTKKDKSKRLEKDIFDITEFVAHEKTADKQTFEEVEKREQDKPKQPVSPLEDNESRVGKPKDKGRKEKTPDTDKPVKLSKTPEQPIESVKPKEDKDKKGKKPGKDKPEELAKAPAQFKQIEEAKDDKEKKAPEELKGQDSSEVFITTTTTTGDKEKDRKEKPTQKDKDTFDITKVIEKEKSLPRDTLEKVGKPEEAKPKEQKPKTDKPEDMKDVNKDKSRVVKREVVETITLTEERLPSKDFIEVTKLIKHEKSPVKEQLLLKEDEPADDRKKGKGDKTPHKDNTQQKVTDLIDHEKPQKEDQKPSKVGMPTEDKDSDKIKRDKEDKPKDLEKEVIGTMEFIQREKISPDDRGTFKTGKAISSIVKAQEPEKPSNKEELSKIGKNKDEKALEKYFDLGKTTETKEPSKVSKPTDKERKETTPKDAKPSEPEKSLSKKPEVIEDKPREGKSKETTIVEESKQFGREPDDEKLASAKQKPTKVKPDKEKDKTPEQTKFLLKDEESSEGVELKEGQKKVKGRKEKTPEEERKPVEAFKPEEKYQLQRKEPEPSALDKPKDDKDIPDKMDKTVQESKTPVGKDKGKKEKPEEKDEVKSTKKHDKSKKEKTPDKEESKPGKDISETLKFIQFGYRVSPESSEDVKPTEDKPKETLKGKSPDKDISKHKIVKVIETTETIQEPKDGRYSDKVKIDKEKTPEGKTEPLKKVTADVRPTDTEKIRAEEQSKMVKPEPKEVFRGEKSSQVDKLKEEKGKSKKDKIDEDKLKSADEGRIPERGTKEKTPEDRFKPFGKEKVEELKPTGHEKSPVWKDEEPKRKDDKTMKEKPIEEKETTLQKVRDKSDQPLDKDKPATIQKGVVDVITFIQHEKSPARDREPLTDKDIKEKDKEKKDKPKEPSIEKDVTDTTKFIEGEKPVKEEKERKGKIRRDGDKPKTPDTMMEQEPSKPEKLIDVKEKDDKKKEKTPDLPRLQEEEKPKHSGRKEKTPDSDNSKVQEQPKLGPKEHFSKHKDDKERTEKTSIDTETISGVDKLPSKKQEPSKPVKEEDKVERVVDKDKPLELSKKPEQLKSSPEKVGQRQEDEEKGKKDKAPKKDQPTKFDKEPDQLQSGEKPKDDKESFSLSKKLEQPRLPSEEEILLGVKPTDKEKERTPEEDKSKPGKIVTATLKFIQQETYPSQQDEPQEISKSTQDKPKQISKEKSPAVDTTKRVVVQITEKIKDEQIPFESQDPSKVDTPAEEKDKDTKTKSTREDKSKTLDKDGFGTAAFIEHEKPSARDTKDKTKKPEETKPKDDKQRKEKPRQPEPLLEGDELLRDVKLIGRKQKTPDTDKSVEMGKTPDQAEEIRQPKDDKDKKGKKPGKDALDKIEKREEEKPKDSKETDEKPKQSTPTLQDDELFRGVKLIGRKEKTPDKGTPAELGKEPEKPTESVKFKDDKDKKGKKPGQDKPEDLAKESEKPKQIEKTKDENEKKDKTTEPQLDKGKVVEKMKLLPDDDELLRIARLTGRKEKTSDKDKPVELGKTPEQSSETQKPKDDKDKKERKQDKDEPQKVTHVEDDKEKSKKGKDKIPESNKLVETTKKPDEEKLPSEKDQLKVGKSKGRKEKTPDEEGKLKPDMGVTETLKFIQQETFPSQEDELLKEPKGVAFSDKDKGLKGTTSKFGVDTLETAKLIEREKPESMKPDELKFKIITQGYDEEGKPIEEEAKKKPGDTPEEYETTKDGRKVVVSYKKDEYPRDNDFKKKDKKKPDHDDSKPLQKKTPETEADKRTEKDSKGERVSEEVDETKGKLIQTPEKTEDKQKEPVTGVAKPEEHKQKIFAKEPEKAEDRRVRQELIGKDAKSKPGVEKVQEDTQDSFASIVRRGERKTPETTKEKLKEPEPVKSKKKGRKPKSPTKHDEDLSTEEDEDKTAETAEEGNQPTDDQTSITGTIVSMAKKVFGLPFGGRKESKPEVAKPEEDTKPSSKTLKEDKTSEKKDKKKKQEESTEKPTEGEPIKVVTAKEKKPEPVGKEKTVSLGWSVPDEPEEKQSETSKTILFPDKPSETQPQHGVIPAHVDKKPEADAFGKLVHKPQKPEKTQEADEVEGKPNKPTAPTYADLFTQTSTPEISPRDTDKVHKTSQTKEYRTTEEGIQTEDDHGKVPVHEYRVHARKDGKPDDGKQTTEKYQQTSKPQSPTVTTTTVSSQTSPQVMSPEERVSKKKEKVIRAKFVDKKSGMSKSEDEDKEDEDEQLESQKPSYKIVETKLTRPGEEKPEKGGEEPLGVYVKAKVSVTPTDVPSKSKKDDKKERKRKWKSETGHTDEPADNIEVTGVVSVDSPKDLIESETQSWRMIPTPQTEISVNVKQGDKFVTDFLEGERAALDTGKDDPKGKKDKKSKKPIKDREDDFSLRERGEKPKGVPSRKDSSPSSESDEPRDKDEKYDIDVNVRVAGDKSKGIRTPGSKRAESGVDINAGVTFDPSDERRARREKGTKPEDDEKYKVSVDVKVKSGETPPKTPGKTVDMGTNIPSPETPLELEDLNLYLEKAKTLGKDRSKKMQNMKNNKRGFTWIIPSSRFTQGEPVKSNIKQIDDNMDKLRDAIARRDYILIQRIFVYLIRNIDDWLELVEYRIRLNRGNPNEGPNQDKVNELRYLNDEIDGVGKNVRELLKAIKNVPSSDKSDIIYQLRTYVEQLEPQIKEIQETTEMEKDNAVKDLSRWEEFLNGVNNLSVIVTENRNNLERVLDSDGSTRSKLEELEKIEQDNREYMDRALKLIALAKDLANDFPNQEIPPETYTTLETTKMVQSNLDSERDRLLQLLSLADEYEQTLKEFAQVIEVADNLVESPITITSLQHLQDEMQKHRKFFVNLSHCRAILESLESNLDNETRGLYNSLHTKLHTKASSILDKAASRAQQMAMAASKWTILDKGVRNEQQWLQVAHQRLPDLQQVKSTDYDQYISLYQSLASDTAMHHAKILQLMDVANNLQDIITCVGLERFYDDYLNVILKLQEEIRLSLEKLLAFQDMWTLYEIMTKKLDAWMKTTEEELKTLKAAPDRAKMRQFWELKAQYEVHNKLKQEMGNNFEKAVQFLPIADEMYQRQILGKLEDRWKKLEKEIKGIQDSAMATLSAPDVPVNEKLKLLEEELNELNDTVNDLHGIIKTDEELNLYIERLQVLNKRLDTIQEELGRLGLLPATESEKVGYLLGLARGLEQQLLEELNQSHCLREKLLALQKGLERTKRNQNSITGMLDQCGAAQSMGSEVVEQAVKTCENVSADLSDQWQDMMDLRNVLHNLPMKLRLSVSPIGVEREFSQLQEIHAVLEERCASLLHLLRHRLSLWKKFEKQLEKVQQNLEDTDYMVELLTLQGSVDFDRLQTATDRLKDLHDSVAEREDLIKELKELAGPLISSCDKEVASQLNAQVDETVTAWNDTKKNLYHIVDKYKDAVKLWKNYREGRDDIRKWIDQQWGALDILQDKPEEALQHIKECKETLANQKARLDELKKLVAQIAADIGLDPGSFLECEVEDLGKRLEDVKDTLTTLTSVAESNTQGKDDCKDELIKAKKFLGSVQKSLNVVGEDGNTLSTLRDHLLALTKTESQVQNVKERSIKMNEKPHEIRNETSVVEILELWQQVFQETFQQYYRLSAKLVKSQDGAAALQLWQEYLRHVQTFLAGSLPEDYDGLRETQRLCEVHQNLLTSQQSVLLSRKDDPGIRDFSQALQEQFNSLANLHNETLARIMDRHNEVNKRLKLWDTYRHDQSKLLSWLRDMTRDQSRLQLRYIHLRRLPKLLEQIDMLLSRIPQGKAQIQEQKKQQDDIVKFCDEALATSIKMESVATAERINNIEASLKSWKDFLNRVQDLHKNYESELEKVEKVCDEITNDLSSPAPVSFSAIQSRLDLCRDLKRRISELSKNIEEANVTYDQLKECLSPYDMKMLSQRLWLMGQRQGDLEHHLLLQILWLEDRLETQQAFNRRHGRFVNWADDVIKRFDKNSSADPTNKFLDLETRAKRLETEVEIELNLKNREYNALHAMANNIIDLSKEDAAQKKGKVMPKGQNRIDYEIMKSDVEKKIKEIDELWDKLKNLKCARLERKSNLTTTMNDLWKRMEDIKLWLISIEKKLEAPNVIEKSNKKCIDKLLKDHEAIQENIEKQSGNVGEVLNLCELFLGDPAVDVSGIDTNEFKSAQQALEKRWKAVCLSSTERKNRILGVWELLLELSKICKEQEKWLNDREKALQSLSNQSDNLKLNDVQKMLGLLEKEKQELESRSPALKILDASYSKLAQESRLPADNIKQLAGPAKAMISKWHNLNGKWKNVWDKISRINKLRDDFIKSQNGSIVLLTNISAKLMQAELIPNAKKRLKKVNELEKELERESGVLRKADETGLELMRTCPEDQNVSATQKMVDEYQIMWKELRDRFADVKNKSLENVESKEIQVSTLAFETDSEVQVDTLPHMDRLTSRDAYGFELDVALRECDQNLTGLEKILRSSEEEMGANAPSHKALAKIIATCTSSVELVQHLNKTLLEDCGMNDRDARTVQVNEISARFLDLVARAREREKQLREASERGRLTCPICSDRNWQQLENDLWRLEQWIQYAEAIQRNRPSMPESIEALEDVIQAHRELLIDLDSHKSIIVSLNIVGDHLADHADDEEKARSLRERLKGLNLRWDNVCTQAAQWQGKLQKALIENPEFHDIIDDLFRWLENTESVIRNSEPVDLAQDKVIIEAQYKKFKILSKELENFEPRVQSLQEAAVQLLDKGGSARERLNALRLRLLGMRRLIKVYLIRLGAVLGNESIQALDQTLMSLSQEMLDGAETMSQVPSSSTAHTDGDGDIDNSSLRRGFRFLGRVFRASLPIQALMLLVLGAATLIPDEYYSCAFSNNARLQSYYPEGPPPI